MTEAAAFRPLTEGGTRRFDDFAVIEVGALPHAGANPARLTAA